MSLSGARRGYFSLPVSRARLAVFFATAKSMYFCSWLIAPFDISGLLSGAPCPSPDEVDVSFPFFLDLVGHILGYCHFLYPVDLQSPSDEILSNHDSVGRAISRLHAEQ
jgi:hypothetical protein